MVSTQLHVVSGTEQVGTLTRTDGAITFRYAPGWQQQPGATPLSVSMPREFEVHADDTVTPWLWGLLPDNDRVLARWARTFHTTAKQPLGLLAAVGADLPGQFQILTAQAAVAPTSSGVEWLTDDDVAGRLREVRADQTAWLGTGAHAGRWSLAGAQAKIALRRDGSRWGRPYGRAATTHILKPAITGLDDHDLNEHLCLQAARHAGLLAVPTSIVEIGDERAICIERYDRVITDTGDIVRIHQEDLCQALKTHPEHKYEADGGPGTVGIGALLTRCMPVAASRQDRERFVDALALNWLIGGTDAHAKNYALLLSGAQVRLAPLYDVASALPYPDVHPDKLRLAMRVGGQYQASRITADRWCKAAAQLDLDADDVVGRVAALAGRLPAGFAAAAGAADVAALASALPQQLTDFITARCATLGQRLR